MIDEVIALAAGLFLVCKGGDLFVDSSVYIATVMRVPRIIVGGTLVSLATTLPELVVSVTASVMKNPGIALGNAVGSVICNIGLILGGSAVLCQLSVPREDFRRRSLWLLVSSVLVILFSWSLYLSRPFAAILLGIFVAYLYFDYRQITSNRGAETAETKTEPEGSLGKSIGKFLIGALLVVVGSRLLVKSAVAIATALGIPSIIIGLTIVAVGTSLPELVTAITAAKKGCADLSIGNIIGANILNLTLITGASGVIFPLTLTRLTQVYSFSWLMIFVLLVMFLFWKEGKLGKRGGILLFSLYLIYLIGVTLIPFL